MIKIGDLEFSSKASALDFTRSKIRSFDGREKFWFDLIERHPEREFKVGGGVAKFILVPNGRNRNASSTAILRVDGTTEVFSWKVCITGVGTSAQSLLNQAMRFAVKPQIDNYRAMRIASRNLNCHLCGTQVRTGNNMNVDHAKIPFRQLRDEFIGGEDRIPTEFEGDKVSRSPIFLHQDSSFKEKWIKYHDMFAFLNLLCATCNREKGDKSDFV